MDVSRSTQHLDVTWYKSQNSECRCERVQLVYWSRDSDLNPFNSKFGCKLIHVEFECRCKPVQFGRSQKSEDFNFSTLSAKSLDENWFKSQNSKEKFGC